jgi:hypothetical protein
MCGQLKRFAAQWPIGPVCFHCYSAARAKPRACQSCGELRVLVGSTEPTASSRLVVPTLCGLCSGTPRFAYICLRCGGGEEPYKQCICVRCAVRDQLARAFGDWPPGSTAAILINALAESRRPRSVMKWLTNPRGGARILRELLDAGTPVTHAVLDGFDAREAWSLRRTLVSLDVLPKRNENIERLETVLDRICAGLRPEHRSLVRAYASWRLLRRSRRSYETSGKFTYQQFHAASTRLSQIASFVSWLALHRTTLHELDQATIERWLNDTNHAHPAVADFLHWAARRGLAPDLTLTFPRSPGPALDMTEEERWSELNRCLSDASMPEDVRTAGALLLLYGIPLARIVELTTAHLDFSDGTSQPSGFSVAPGRPAVVIPPILGRLLIGLRFRRSSYAPLISANPSDPDWLFPGCGPGGHISWTAMARRLKAHGIRVRRSRNAALIALAGDLPAPVLSDLLGMSTAAAIQWSRRAGRDWLGFINALEQRQSAARTTVRRPASPI